MGVFHPLSPPKSQIKSELEKLPSVQPGHIAEVGKMDCISRQAAKLKVARVIWEDGESCYDFHDKCVDCLDDVPSAQPGWIPFPEPKEG